MLGAKTGQTITAVCGATMTATGAGSMATMNLELSQVLTAVGLLASGVVILVKLVWKASSERTSVRDALVSLDKSVTRLVEQETIRSSESAACRARNAMLFEAMQKQIEKLEGKPKED